MTNLLDYVLEFILLGTVDGIFSKRAPVVLRVLLAALLLTVCLGLFALLLFVGIQTKQFLISVAAFLVLISIGVLIFSKIKHINRQ